METEELYITRPLLTDYQIDLEIEAIGELKEQQARIDGIFKERMEKLNYEYNQKMEKYKNEIEARCYNLGQVIKIQESELKESKTQFKKVFFTGEVIIKKPYQRLIKPLEIDLEDCRILDYTQTEKKLVWAELKGKLTISENKVINIETGEDLTDIISIEDIQEKYDIKIK